MKLRFTNGRRLVIASAVLLFLAAFLLAVVLAEARLGADPRVRSLGVAALCAGALLAAWAFASVLVRRDGGVPPRRSAAADGGAPGGEAPAAVLRRLTAREVHDLNNALLALQGHADLARAEKDAGPAARRRLDDLDGALRRASEIVSALWTAGRRSPAAAPVSPPAAAAAENAARGGNGRQAAAAPAMILLAEDDRSVRELAARVLQSEGYVVLEAADGEEALELFRGNRHAVRLAVLDDVMPKMNGRAVMEKVREIAPALPVILCTGYSWSRADASLSAPAAEELLPKPWEPREMLRRVRRLLR